MKKTVRVKLGIFDYPRKKVQERIAAEPHTNMEYLEQSDGR